MGPISAGLGEIFQNRVEAPGRDLIAVREIQDWIVRPQLRSVPGVAQVNAFGGFENQYQVQVRTGALVKYGVTLDSVSV